MTETIAVTQLQSTDNRTSLNHVFERRLKRTLDFLAALAGLVVLSPAFAIIAIKVKQGSPGPVFYRGRRVGLGGKEFKILKFRTMYERPESYLGPVVTAGDDQRVTEIGRWLRRTKLNELPQLWNVLKGEMSLVGPRPEHPEVVETWPRPVRDEVLSIRPGITSPASVTYRDEEKLLQPGSVMDDYLRDVVPEKLRLDQLYVRHHNFLSDVDVIFMTLIVLLPKLRSNTVRTESLYNGILYRLARRYVSWFVLDTLTAFVAVTLAGTLRRLEGPLDLGVAKCVAVATVFAFTFSLVNSILGLGKVSWRHAAPSYALSLGASSFISTLFILIVELSWPGTRPLPLSVVPLAGVLAWLGFMAVRYRERLLTGLATQWLLLLRGGQAEIGERVLIVGAGDCSLTATWLLKHSRVSSAFSVIGMVDDNPTEQGMVVDGHLVLGLTSRIPEIVKKQDVGVILFAIENIDPLESARIIDLCRSTSARLVVIPDLLRTFRHQFRPVSAGLGETAD